MANIANIVVFDGATTPVAHTLIPISVEKDQKSGRIEATWREQVASLPTYAQVTFRVTMVRTNKSGIWHVDARVEIPVMEAVAGANASGYTAAPKVAFTDTTGMYGHYSERGTIAGRRLSKQLMLNVGNNVSTSVPPVSAGVLDELFSTLVTPT